MLIQIHEYKFCHFAGNRTGERANLATAQELLGEIEANMEQSTTQVDAVQKYVAALGQLIHISHDESGV